MPAYNAAKTLERTTREIPQGLADEILVVDDASSDETVSVAKRLGLSVIAHPKNLGYGGNQKTCYRWALERGADIVAMIHPDYQYDPKLLPYLTGLIAADICDVMLGSRIRTRREALKGGMPLYKYLANRALTFAENIILGLALSEFHTGYRAFSRKALQEIPWEKNSDDFVFDQEILVQAAHFGFRIGEIPVPARYFLEASSIGFSRSLLYGLATLTTLAKYLAAQAGLKSKIFCR